MTRFLRTLSTRALAAAIAIALAACSPDGEMPGERHGENADDGGGAELDPSMLDGRTWRFERVGDEAVPDDLEITLEIAPGNETEAGRLVGLAACNRYTAEYSLDGSALKVGAPASTKRACPTPAMAAEARFLDALRSAATLTVDAQGRLVLTDADGRRSIARPEAPIDETEASD
ncbi:META domain-containing protein [Halomonas denitrificans]|nr:META domain-containing protein [Halomonas denitrificans]